MKTITITIDEKGDASMEIQGVAGACCLKDKAACELAELIGGKTSTKLTADYYKQEVKANQRVGYGNKN